MEQKCFAGAKEPLEAKALKCFLRVLSLWMCVWNTRHTEWDWKSMFNLTGCPFLCMCVLFYVCVRCRTEIYDQRKWKVQRYQKLNPKSSLHLSLPILPNLKPSVWLWKIVLYCRDQNLRRLPWLCNVNPQRFFFFFVNCGKSVKVKDYYSKGKIILYMLSTVQLFRP